MITWLHEITEKYDSGVYFYKIYRYKNQKRDRHKEKFP
jgi:hypothetical protein